MNCRKRRRELKEELGIEAKEFIELGTVHHTTSVVNSATTLYLARNLSFGEEHPDGSENIKTVKLPLAEAVEMALNGELTHASTCTLVLRAQNRLKRLSSIADNS
jgi:ADP-ribose pyrophosphatase